jgi:monomeric isocitrate dehydrogenase
MKYRGSVTEENPWIRVKLLSAGNMMMPVFREITSWITNALHRRSKQHLPKKIWYLTNRPEHTTQKTANSVTCQLPKHTLTILLIRTLAMLSSCDIHIPQTNSAHTSTAHSMTSTIFKDYKFYNLSVFLTCLFDVTSLGMIWRRSKHVEVLVEYM